MVSHEPQKLSGPNFVTRLKCHLYFNNVFLSVDLKPNTRRHVYKRDWTIHSTIVRFLRSIGEIMEETCISIQ